MKNMTVEEFNKALHAGLGRCVQFLESCEDKEPYREAVLNACLNDYAYDGQCEGTRAWYTYRLLSCFNDGEYFYSRLQHKLREVLCWKGNNWEFEHFFDLVLQFAVNGHAEAKALVEDLYWNLLSCLSQKQKGPEPYKVDFERQWLEYVCMAGVTVGGLDAFVEIADDLGGLFWCNAKYNAQSFDQLIELADSLFGRENIVSALNAVDDYTGTIADYMQSVAEDLKPIPVPTAEEKERIAKARAGRGNDRKCDVDKIMRDIKRYDNADRDGDWHSVALDIVHCENTVLPMEAYIYVYTGLCACCRKSVVEAMHKHGLLTDELLRECEFDCYDETREFAKSIMQN